MARDTQIVNSASGPAPKDYTLPGNSEILLRSVQATFTDNGAGVDWLPCVDLISDSDHRIVRACDPNVKVTAGDDAEVSWFPCRVAPAASSGGVLAPDWGLYYLDPVTVSAGARGFPDCHFQLVGDPVLNVSVPSDPKVAARGLYAVDTWVQSSDAWTPGALCGARLGYGSPTSYQTRATGGVDAATIMRNFHISLTAQADAGTSLDFEFENFDTASRTIYSNQVLVQLISPF